LELLQIGRECRSLMLVGIMYWYIKLLHFQLKEEGTGPQEAASSNANEGGGNGSRRFWRKISERLREGISKNGEKGEAEDRERLREEERQARAQREERFAFTAKLN
jgi:gas vesicle protein